MEGDEQTYPLVDGDSPLVPDAVAAPEVTYGEQGNFIDYYRRNGGWARVVFHRWDAMRISRGEAAPYRAAEPDGPWVGLGVVRPSAWLRQRYEYEARHYGKSYCFGNDVKEMLTEFDHYLFCFHDEFIEVIAGGLHFDLSDERQPPWQLGTRPGWAELPESAGRVQWTCSGIECKVRVDPRTNAEIVEASKFCDQCVVQVALELDGRARVSQRLAVRTRDGVTISRWRGYFGKILQTFEGIPPLESLRPLVEEHAAEVRERRASMRRG